MLYEFYLWSDNYINSDTTTNLEYALSWLLNNLHNNISGKYYIEIRKKTIDSNTQYIKEGVIMWEDSFIVKKLNFDDQLKTIYSPYDLSLFDKTHLSLSYCNLIEKYKQNKLNLLQSNKKHISNFKYSNIHQSEEQNSDSDDESISSKQLQPQLQPQSQPQLQPQSQPQPQPQSQPQSQPQLQPHSQPQLQPQLQPPQSNKKHISNFKQVNKLLDETNNIFKSSNIHQSEEQNSDSDDESISSNQLHELEKNLDQMMNEQKEFKKTLEEKKDKLADIIMEENYKKTLKAKEENKKKEQRNIFNSDYSIYKKINKQNSKVPDFFMAKCVVFNYLDKNKYLNNENLENPSDEIFELFTILYNSRFVDNYEPPEDFEEIVLDFIESLPDIEIMTEREFHDRLNKIDGYGMFSTDIVNIDYCGDKNSC